jgi:beta-lactamase regulating signal transducer with metallopeptidase domain
MTALFDLAIWISQSPVPALLVKTSAVLGSALAVAALLRTARASTRHLVLGAAFAIVLMLPPGAWVGPATDIPLPLARGGDSGATSPRPLTPRIPPSMATAAAAAPGPIPWIQADRRLTPWLAVASVWTAGALLLITSLAGALWRLDRMRRRALPCLALTPVAQQLAAASGLRRPLAVLTHERVSAPLTCGVLRPSILLPADAASWSDAAVRRALLHEIEHARRGDWLVQIAARLVCALYWFNPLAWAANRRLGLEAERACDDAVLQLGSRTEYADQLVALAARWNRADAPVTLGMARRSDLSVRVAAILDPRQRRGRAGPTATAAAGAASLAIVLLGAPARVVIAASPLDPGTPQRASRASSDRALYRAAERGDLERLGALVAEGANVNATFEGDGSPLIAAARAGRLPAVRLLLDAGADPGLGVPGDGSPLIVAAREGHTGIVALLLDRGALIDQVVEGDENALIQASGRGHLPVVQLLVSRGADVNALVWAETYTTGNASGGVQGGVAGGVSGGVPGGVPGGVTGGVRGGVVGGVRGEWRSPLSMARAGRHAAVVAFLESVGARQ